MTDGRPGPEAPPYPYAGEPPPVDRPPAEQWKQDKTGRFYVSRRDGRPGVVYRLEDGETVEQARARDTAASSKRPRKQSKKPKPKMPDAPREIELKELERIIAEALKQPGLIAAAFGDEWAAEHFVRTAPAVARNLVVASQHNPWLRRKLEEAATGQDAAMAVLSLVPLAGAIIMYLAPPLIYFFDLPVSPRGRKMLGDIPYRNGRPADYASTPQSPRRLRLRSPQRPSRPSSPRPPRPPRPSPSRPPTRPPDLGRLRLSPLRPEGSAELDGQTARGGDQLPQFVRWDRFLAGWRWKAGEHLTTIGPTGSGKTVLNRYLLRRRKFVIVLGVKRRDDELYGPFRADGYKLVHKFDLDDDSKDNDPKVLFVPTTDKHGAEARKDRQKQFRLALNDIYDARAPRGEENWTVYADDVRYQSDQLGLRTEFEELWIAGRSEGITMVASSQEPVDIPVMAYGQATHLFLFRSTDKRRADRMAELTGVNREVTREVLLRLPSHQFLYVNRESGEMLTSIVIR